MVLVMSQKTYDMIKVAIENCFSELTRELELVLQLHSISETISFQAELNI